MPDIPQIIPRTTAIKTGLVNALLTSPEGLIFSPACSEDCCDLILIKRLISASVFCRSRKEIHVTEGIVISEVAQIFIDKGADLPPFFWGDYWHLHSLLFRPVFSFIYFLCLYPQERSIFRFFCRFHVLSDSFPAFPPSTFLSFFPKVLKALPFPPVLFPDHFG